MNEIRRGLGVAVTAAPIVVLYDAARLAPENLPPQGTWLHLGEAALAGLVIYFIALTVAVVPLAIAISQGRRSRAGGTGGAGSGLPIHAGACALLIVAANTLCLLTERRGEAAWKTSSLAVDLLLAAPGCLAVGWVVGRAVRWALAGGRRSPRLAALAAALALPALVADARLVALTAAMSPAAADRPATVGPGLPDIVLIVASTTRADALSCYGARSTTTPAIDALAARGVRFADAMAQSPSSAPATAAILTGRPPSGSGVGARAGAIAAGARTLAETLAGHGYATSAIVADPVISRARRFDRGFASWEQDLESGVLERHPEILAARLTKVGRPRGAPSDPPPASRVVNRALALLAGGAAPRFLYVHLADPQPPWVPPRDLAAAADPGYTGTLAFGRGTLDRIVRGEISVDAADLRHARALYDAEVGAMDREIGRLLGALEDRIAAGKVIVVMTSDHGEEFMEHGAMGHGHTLYQELLRIPLIVARPGSIPSGAVVDETAAQIDVAPTILALAGLPPEPAFSGRSLLAAIRGGPAEGGEGAVILSESDDVAHRGAAPRMRAARSGSWKVILRAPDLFGIGDWRREAYDLAADPGETASLPPGTEAADRLETLLRSRIGPAVRAE